MQLWYILYIREGVLAICREFLLELLLAQEEDKRKSIGLNHVYLYCGSFFRTPPQLRGGRQKGNQ
jgi:hypothetical protein